MGRVSRETPIPADNLPSRSQRQGCHEIPQDLRSPLSSATDRLTTRHNASSVSQTVQSARTAESRNREVTPHPRPPSASWSPDHSRSKTAGRLRGAQGSYAPNRQRNRPRSRLSGVRHGGPCYSNSLLSFKQWRALPDARDSTCPQHRTLVDTDRPANGLLLPLLVPVANHMGKTCPPDRSRRPETTTMFHVKPLHRRSIETDDPTPYHAQGEQWASGPGRADSPAVSQCTGNRRHTAVSQRPIADVEPGPPSCDRQCDCHRVHGRAALQASKSHRTLLPTPSAGGPHDRMRAH